MENDNTIKVSKNVIRIDNEYWHHYHKMTEKKQKITGKYLFFSENKDELENIAINELESGIYLRAKINTDQHKKGTNYVLCLYYIDDSRKFELAKKYEKNPNIKYRYWKTDEDTLKGKYSKQFLKQLSSKEKIEWTKRKI